MLVNKKKFGGTVWNVYTLPDVPFCEFGWKSEGWKQTGQDTVTNKPGYF